MSRRARRSEHCWEEVLNGQVTPESAAHLVACDVCARMVQGVDRAVDAVFDDLAPLPADVDERVLAAIEREQAAAAAPRRRRFVLPSFGWGGGIAGLATVAAAIALVFLARSAIHSDSAQAIPIGPLTADCKGSGSRQLLVAGVWDGKEAKNFARVLERFERRTGVQVRYAYETRDIAAKLETRIRRGCPPDVALLPQPGLIERLAEHGQIQPLGGDIGGLVRRNYSPSWRRLTTFDGKLYGVWFKVADKSTLWYNAAAFGAAGIKHAPTTWSALEQAAQALRASGIRPFSVAGADGWTLTDWFENVYLRSAGPQMYDALAEHRIPWTDPSVKDAMHRLLALIGDETFAGPRGDVLRTSFEESVRQVFARRPQAAMVYEGDFVRSFIPAGRAAAAGAPRDGSFFDFPGFGHGPPSSTAVVGGDIAVMFTRTRAARQLMRFLATADAAMPWARAGGFLSPNQSVDRRAYPDAPARRTATTLTAAQIIRFDLSDLQPPAFGATEEQGMWRIFRDLLRHPGNVDAIAARLEAAARAAFACERALAGRC